MHTGEPVVFDFDDEDAEDEEQEDRQDECELDQALAAVPTAHEPWLWQAHHW